MVRISIQEFMKFVGRAVNPVRPAAPIPATFHPLTPTLQSILSKDAATLGHRSQDVGDLAKTVCTTSVLYSYLCF